MIRAVIFDYGGVVTNETYYEIERIISDMFGINLKGIRERISEPLSRFQRGLTNEREFWQELNAEGVTNLPKKIFVEFWVREYHKRVKVDEDVLGLVGELKAKGYRVGLLSNTIMPYVRYLRKKGMYRHFDPVILSCEVGFEKPQREIYELALQRLGLKPEHCVFVDDVEEYVEGAKDVGMEAFLFKDVEQLRKDLLSCGVKL